MQQNSDYSILNTVVARLVRSAKDAEPVLGLEVIDGPYKGVVFSFAKFIVQNNRLENGMVPAKFEVAIWKAPEGFQQDEGFDEYSRDVLLAWLGYISTHNFSALLAAETTGVH
jgi:hypothetical protein